MALGHWNQNNRFELTAAHIFNSKISLKKYRKAEYVQRRVCFANVQSSLHQNDVFSVCARMDNAAYNKFIMWNSISYLDTSYHFRFSVVMWLPWGEVIKKMSGNF